ncbi:hypothetical protein [Luteipulveratus halotolerans]|uniref:Uncharacterized protein n=1 Tax=Luteipulveratus halotolerans TaxID=1631356 RepID=A0A0L6CFR7_9MICO|nr:hypothetical protein [Luteipulveratus halotolerans]KNX36539.1 hypothetical protein VV01_04230 [Luteipulveratus halotolerans]
MDITTMKSMTCESTGMPITAAFMRPILGSARVEVQGISVSAVVRERAVAGLADVQAERLSGAGVPVIATDRSAHPYTKSFADGVVRSASWSHPV